MDGTTVEFENRCLPAFVDGIKQICGVPYYAIIAQYRPYVRPYMCGALTVKSCCRSAIESPCTSRRVSGGRCIKHAGHPRHFLPIVKLRRSHKPIIVDTYTNLRLGESLDLADIAKQLGRVKNIYVITPMYQVFKIQTGDKLISEPGKRHSFLEGQDHEVMYIAYDR